MYGRNGPDGLYNFIWICSLVILVVSIPIRAFVSPVAGYILYGVAMILLVISILRVLSRNVEARRRENMKYLQIKGRIKSFFVRQKNRRKYKDTYIYVRCESCKNILRLPRSVGKHTVKCPCCRHEFEIENK